MNNEQGLTASSSDCSETVMSMNTKGPLSHLDVPEDVWSLIFDLPYKREPKKRVKALACLGCVCSSWCRLSDKKITSGFPDHFSRVSFNKASIKTATN